MDKEKESEPSKLRFIMVLAIFYIAVVLILYIMDSQRYFQTSTIVTIFAAIVGPSVPSFLAIYLSRYSEQARVSRKQELVLNISIQKEILEARKEHYKELSIRLEEMKSCLLPPNPRNIHPYPKNPLLLDKFETDKLKEFMKDTSVKQHLENYKVGMGNFSIQRLVDSLDDSGKVNQNVNDLESKILSELQKLLTSDDSIVANEVAVNTKNKTCIGTKSLVIVLANIWTDLFEHKNNNSEEFVKQHFPQRPNPSNLKNETIGDWNIETPNLTFRNTLVLTYTDKLLANYDVLDILKKLITSDSLKSEFKALYDRVTSILELIQNAKDLISKLQEQITNGQYWETFNCCPYNEVDLNKL